jgi:hypothetical protein
MPTSRAERWRLAPVALLLLDAEARVLDANDEFLRLLDVPDVEAIAGRRLADLLTVGGRIYWETHLGPRLHEAGRVDEVAVELRTPAGREPMLLTAIERDVRGERLIEVAMLAARERSRFEHELVAARRAAEAAERRVRTLHGTAADLASAAGLEGVASVLLRAAVTVLGAQEAALWVTQDSKPLRRWFGVVGGVARSAPAAEEWVVDPPTTDELTATTTREGGDVVVPLRTVGTLLGVLVLRPRRAPGAEALDLGTVTAAGQLAALALARAQTHEQSMSVATELQHAMLADGIVRDPRVRVAARYRPGVHDLHVGGDWYDTFLVTPDALAVSVGDVVGRGLGAATAMGQLRTAARAGADAGLGPELVVDRLDRFVERTGTGFMASLVYAELDLVEGTLRYSCAGHLPPLLVRADGDAGFLWHARSTPLGVRGAAARAADGVVLAPGDTLLLYTDGVVERRGRSLTAGLDELAEVVTNAFAARVPVDEVLGALVDRAVSHDDACVLAVRWLGPGSADEERSG